MSALPFILFTVLTNAAAQLMLKQGMATLPELVPQDGWTPFGAVEAVLRIVFHPWVFAGLTTFVISMASHLYVLSRVELSFAYPFLSLAYVVVAVATWWLWAEDMNAWRIFGIALICAGTIAIAQGGDGAAQPTDNMGTATAHAPASVAREGEAG